jgi:hypothetical protein
LVVEGAAGAGKTNTLEGARRLLEHQGHRLVVVTPTQRQRRSPPKSWAPARSQPRGWPTSTASAGTTTAPGHAKTSTNSLARRCFARATSCSSTRPACSTRTPPWRC